MIKHLHAVISYFKLRIFKTVLKGKTKTFLYSFFSKIFFIQTIFICSVLVL